MAQERLAAELGEVLERYQRALDDVSLDLPGFAPPPPPPNYFPDARVAAPVRPAAPLPEPTPIPAPAREAPIPVPKTPPARQAAPVSVEPEVDPPAEETIAQAPAPPAAEPVFVPPATPRPIRTRPAGSAPQRPSWVFVAGAAAALIIAVVVLLPLALRQGDAQARSVPLAAAVTGLAAQDGRVYAVDDASQQLLSFSGADGTLEARQPFPKPDTRGLALSANGVFWTTDADLGVLYERADDDGHAVDRVFSYPQRYLGSIAFTSDSLWAVDTRTGQIYQYLVSKTLTGPALTPVNAYRSPASGAAWIHADDNALWLCDPGERTVTRYRPGPSQLTPIDAIDLGEWISSGGEITGFAVTADSLWIATKGPDELYRVALSELRWKAAN